MVFGPAVELGINILQHRRPALLHGKGARGVDGEDLLASLRPRESESGKLLIDVLGHLRRLRQSFSPVCAPTPVGQYDDCESYEQASGNEAFGPQPAPCLPPDFLLQDVALFLHSYNFIPRRLVFGAPSLAGFLISGAQAFDDHLERSDSLIAVFIERKSHIA